jgi:hypothetical protein
MVGKKSASCCLDCEVISMSICYEIHCADGRLLTVTDLKEALALQKLDSAIISYLDDGEARVMASGRLRFDDGEYAVRAWKFGDGQAKEESVKNLESAEFNHGVGGCELCLTDENSHWEPCEIPVDAKLEDWQKELLYESTSAKKMYWTTTFSSRKDFSLTTQMAVIHAIAYLRGGIIHDPQQDTYRFVKKGRLLALPDVNDARDICAQKNTTGVGLLTSTPSNTPDT